MLEFNIGMVVGWFVFMFAMGFVGAWIKDIYRKRRIAKEEESHGISIPVGLPIRGVDVDHNTTPRVRVGVIEAMNGRILEVATATPVPGHSHFEWKMEMYVVPEDKKLSEAISTVMLMKGLER